MSVTNSQKSDRRVQFDLSETLLKEIDELMADCEIATKKDLLNNAVTAFQWMVEQIKDGRVVVSADRDRNDFEVYWMPALRAAQRVSKTRPGSKGQHR